MYFQVHVACTLHTSLVHSCETLQFDDRISYMHNQRNIHNKILYFSELLETATNIKYAQVQPLEQHRWLHHSFTVQHLWAKHLIYLSGEENVVCTMMAPVSLYEMQDIQQALMGRINSKYIKINLNWLALLKQWRNSLRRTEDSSTCL